MSSFILVGFTMHICFDKTDIIAKIFWFLSQICSFVAMRETQGPGDSRVFSTKGISSIIHVCVWVTSPASFKGKEGIEQDRGHTKH